MKKDATVEAADVDSALKRDVVDADSDEELVRAFSRIISVYL